MKMPNLSKKMFKLLYIALIISSLLLISACDKRSIDPNSVKISSIESSSDVLYQDNGATSVVVMAIVKDSNGFPVVGRQVNFRSNYEPVRFLPARCVTDSSGVAQTEVFINGTFPQDSISVNVDAFLDAKYQKSLYLTVYRTANVSSIIIEKANEIVQMPINSDVTIKAFPYNAANEPITDGTRLTFSSNGGFFVDSNGLTHENYYTVSCSNGMASVIFRSGTDAKTIVIDAYVGNVHADTVKTISVLAGDPKVIALDQASSDISYLPVNASSVELTGNLFDDYNNAIANKVVSFTTNLGSINPSSVSTDANGKFTSYFNPGSVAGSAKIDIAADSAKYSKIIQVTSTAVQYLRFTNQGAINLNVSGSGGVESAALSVKLYDNNGNLVVAPGYNIKFKLSSSPEGTQIYPNNDNDATQEIVEAYDGIATISVNSGFKSGPVNVQASLVDSLGAEMVPNVTASQTQIIIQSGPPKTIAFTIGGHDSGVNVGAGNWRIIVGAIIRDMYGNPVDKNTGVYFSINNPEYSDSVTIVGSSYVGNINAVGDSAAGTAYTTMVYHGSLSNLPINLRCEINDTTFAQEDIILPMQGAVLDMAPIPQHKDWPAGDNSPTKAVQGKLVIVDGQGNKLRFVKLTWYCTLGYLDTIMYPDTPYDDNDNDAYTGMTDINGLIYKTLVVNQYEVPAPTPEGPGEIQGTLTAHIVGYENKSISVDFFFRRY